MMNHLLLLRAFYEELKDIYIELRWIKTARVMAPNNQNVQLNLDRKQTELELKKAQIQDAMFDICISN